MKSKAFDIMIALLEILRQDLYVIFINQIFSIPLINIVTIFENAVLIYSQS